MPDALPELRVMVRLVRIVFENGNASVSSEKITSAWEYAVNLWRTKAGVLFVPWRGGLQDVVSDTAYSANTLDALRLVADKAWRGPDVVPAGDGGGRTVFPRPWSDPTERAGIVLEGTMFTGRNLAHELGHLLGLPHTWHTEVEYAGGGEAAAEFLRQCMWPFDDDTVNWDIDTDADNLMKNTGAEGAANQLTWSQICRARLTILRRESFFSRNWGDDVTPEAMKKLFSVVPELTAPHPAVWIG